MTVVIEVLYCELHIMTRLLVLGASGLFWAAMMLALVRREVLPYFEYQAPPSYRELLRDLRAPELTTAEIRAAGSPVGFLESLAEPQFDGTFRIRTRLSMKARFMGPREPGTQETGTSALQIGMKSSTIVDALYRLSRVSCELDLGFGLAMLQAARDKESLKITHEVRVGRERFAGGTQNIEFPSEGMMGDLFQPFPGGGPLYIGKKWKIPTITADLKGAQLAWLYAAVTDREEILWNEKPVRTYRVEIRKEPTEEQRPTHISWCRDDGVALVQQMTLPPLVYEIVLVTRRTLTRFEAHAWNAKFGRLE